MNDFQKGLVNAHTYHGYMNHFKALYQFGGIIEFALVAFSAVCSTPFYAAALQGLGEASLYIGGAIACFVGFAVFLLHKKALAYYTAQGTLEPVLGALLVAFVGLSFYADFKGAPQWGEKIVGSAPADAKTTELGGIYTPQIEAINAEIADIEGKNFYWCGTHNTAHKCASAQYYVDPVGDKKHVAKIEQLKAQRAELQSTMNSLLSDAGKHHNEQVTRHMDKLQGTESFMRGGSIIALALFLLISQWRHTYGQRAITEIKNTPAVSAKNTHTHYNTPAVGVAKRRPVARRVKGISFEAEQAYNKLAKELPELEEERRAMEEAESQRAKKH